MKQKKSRFIDGGGRKQGFSLGRYEVGLSRIIVKTKSETFLLLFRGETRKSQKDEGVKISMYELLCIQVISSPHVQINDVPVKVLGSLLLRYATRGVISMPMKYCVSLEILFFHRWLESEVFLSSQISHFVVLNTVKTDFMEMSVIFRVRFASSQFFGTLLWLLSLSN